MDLDVCVQGQMLHPLLRRQRYNLFAYSFKKTENMFTEEYAPTVQDLCGMDDARSDVVDRSSLSFVDHEERRMSDLSDFCWSVVSSVDNQINGDNQVDRPVLFCG